MLRVEALGYRHAHSRRAALDGLDFSLSEGEALLVGGRSGSGKSTLLSALSGLIPHYYKGELKGRVSLDGQSPGETSLADWGHKVGFMMQNPEAQFLAATVEEEIILTLRCRGVPEEEAFRRAGERLERFNLESLKNQSVFQLSEGQKQKVVLAALTALKPKLLLLDEPSANLDPQSILELGALLCELKQEGLSLVIADHRLAWLKGLCDQVLILEEGRTALAGPWRLLEDESRRRELGLRSLDEPADFCPAADFSNAEGLRAAGLGFVYPGRPPLFSGFDCQLPYGRVSVMTGPSGRGKTTLARLLCGLEKPAAGDIFFHGSSQKIDKKTERREVCQLVLQNADHQLYMPSLKREVELLHGTKRGPGEERTKKLLAGFGLEELMERHPQSLSGGEKQRLVVALGLAAPQTRLLVLDEPTSGLDGHHLAMMAGQIKKAAEAGPAVLVITHDLELAHLCGENHLELPRPRQNNA